MTSLGSDSAPRRTAANSKGGLAEAPDSELARALMAHDPEAYRVAWQRFGPMVSRMVRRGYGGGLDGEDVIQEIFLCLFRRAHTLRDPMALRAFVMAIASRTLSFERRRRSARLLPLTTTEPEEHADSLCINADPAAQHAVIILQRMLGRLRKRERRAFVLRFVEGMNAGEVAEALGVSAPTARRSFARALKRINLWASRDPVLADYLRDQ